MSPADGPDALFGSLSPASLKRKRDNADLSPSSASFTAANKSARFNSGLSVRHHGASSAGIGSNSTYMSPSSDDLHLVSSGADILRGNGAANSLVNSESTFHHTGPQYYPVPRKASLANGLTPLSSHSDFSPTKGSSPLPSTSATAMASSNIVNLPASPALTPLVKERPQMLPPQGTAKGYRAVWDPELDDKLSREERKRATMRKREFGLEKYPSDPPPDPRLAIPGYMAGLCRQKVRPSKAITREAPYNFAPYKVDRHSVGPGEPQMVVVTGFDPFLPESTLKLNFSTFGSVASVQNRTNPATGSFLGIALVKFRDSTVGTAADCAKRAEAEFNGQRIGLRTVKVETDREGRRCERYVDHALKKVKLELQMDRAGSSVIPSGPAAGLGPKSNVPAPPLNAPKGPSGRGTIKPPEGPRNAIPAMIPKTAASSLIEEEPVLSKIKRKPYIFIPHLSVPVLGTTIPHLKKRLKSYDWREVRLDKTGYYVIFDDSKRGEDETERCFNECNNAALFTYSMAMECQKYGNPDYERSPSPERAMAEKRKKVEIERLQKEEAEDIEVEKKHRAENLDPVLGALEQLRVELRDKIMGDIKTRIAIPIFHEGLEPSKHAARRRKLGLSDHTDQENKSPALLFSKPGDLSPAMSKGRFGQASKPLRPHDPNQQRGRNRQPSNAFIDERRRRQAPRPAQARGLHFKLQQLFQEEDESDDERHASITRDTEDQESRPLSRASRTSTPFDTDSPPAETPKKRRKVSDWEEEEKEVFDDLHKQLVGHLLHKEPEDLATRELELVVHTLPRSSKYATRARTELYIRQRSKADDDLFNVKAEIAAESVEKDTTPFVETGPEVAKEKAKKKRKTKKQILEELEALESEPKKAKAAQKPAVAIVTKAEELQELDTEVSDDLQPREVNLLVSVDQIRRTVEDGLDIVLDIDGWQHTIKDNEDLSLAKKAMIDEQASDLGDVRAWARKQKEIKFLNSGAQGTVHSETAIEGYYVPNLSGCARTEGVKKILNEEKGKYLPHRIKVQRQREERQALAKANPAAAAEAAKVTAAEKIASTATSRSNRVNNRRLVNDINLQKQSLASNMADADVAIRFNQLKKRKKLVKFDRSAIHGWGLYAEENIAVNDLIIEYVGEKVRQKVADMREIKYDRQGVGSSYLFRMMEDEIVDATKKGGIARFINHSCTPNCTAKIIRVEGTPRIVIYALKDIYKNEELTYDYKFEREIGATDRIPCLCGSANCKGFLN